MNTNIFSNGSTPQIESKNLTILEDQMNYEFLAYKKCKQYSNMFSDQEAAQITSQLANEHKEHFTKLYDYLNSHQ